MWPTLVSHDFWCVWKRLYTCSFCGINSSHRSCTYTVDSELTKNHAKLSRIERVMVRKRFAGGIIVSKSGQKVAESLCFTADGGGYNILTYALAILLHI